MRVPVALVLAYTVATACARESPEAYSPAYSKARETDELVLSFGVHPLHNPQRLFEVYDPIVQHLNGRLEGVEIRLEASRSYEEFERKLFARQLHLALPNPYQTLSSIAHGYRVFGKMGDDEEFCGILIVRKDSGIEKVEDLKGKVVSFPAPTALAATMMPLWFLHTHGLDANREIRRLFSGSQESSILNVYLGRSAAAATWPVPWKTFAERNPRMASALVVRWRTPPLVNNGLVARDDVPRGVLSRIESRLFALQESEEGRRLLAAVPISRFEPATEETYAPVRDFLARYRAVIQ